MFPEHEEGCTHRRRLFFATERRMSGKFLCENLFAKNVGRVRIRGLIVLEAA